jgi:hypothetical protein
MENGKAEPSKKKDIKSGVPASILRIGTWEVSKYMIDEFFGLLNMHLVDVPLIFSGFIIGYNRQRTIFICKSLCW